MKRVVALLLSLIMVLSLATTGFAANGGFTFGDATANSDWDFIFEVDTVEDDLDSQFATYVITASAKKDGALSLWGTATDVYSKGEYADVEIDGEDEFIKVADLSYADFVIVDVDSKVITPFAKAMTYNEKGWEGKANKSVLPALPADEADRVCGTRYNITEIPLVAYYCDDILYVSDADGDTILNCDGVCVVAREAVEGVDYFCKPHDVKVVYDGEKATKVYCDNCEITFPFVQGSEADAIKVFGAGNYHLVENNVWMSTKANTGGGVVDVPSTGGFVARIGTTAYTRLDEALGVESPTEPITLLDDAILTFGYIFGSNKTLVIPEDLTFTVQVSMAVKDGAKIAGGGTIEVCENATLDLYALTREDLLRDFTGKFTIKTDGLVILPSDWGDADWDPNTDATFLAMLKDCEYGVDVGDSRGAKVQCGSGTWKQYFEDCWLAVPKTGGYEAEIDGVFYDTLQEAVDAVENGGTILVEYSDLSAVVSANKEFTLEYDYGLTEATITAADGYKVIVDGNKYTVKKIHTVSYDPNGGTGTMEPGEVLDCSDGSVVVWSLNTSFEAPMGKKLKGWALSPDGPVLEYGISVTKDITLYAIWEDAEPCTPDTHTIMINFSEGKVTRVYCDVCKIEIAFVQGPETAAIAVFGAGNYKLIAEGNIWISLKDLEEVPSAPNGAEAEVVAPTVDSNINTDKIKDAEEKAAVEAVVETLTQPDAVQFDAKANAALSEAAAAVAENDNVKVTEANVKALAGTIKESVKKEEVVVVVQTNFDVKIEEVSVNKNGDATIKLDITPVYQHVATTKDVVESGADIKVGENAVAVSKKPQKVTQKITEPVTITIAIPDVLVDFAKENGNKLYVTHKKTSGTKFVYEAQVNVANKSATFVNPNGFSEFVISVEDTTAAEISGMKYADLQSAIDNAGKNAVITVKIPNQQAVVSNEMTFKLVYEGDAKAENTKITAASGYKLSGPDKEGSYTVTKVSYGYGGYYPSYSPSVTPSAPSVDSDSLTDAALAVGSAIKDGSAEFTPVSGYTKADVTKLQNESKLHLSIEKKIGYASVAEKDLVDAAIKAAGGAVSGTTVMYYDIKPVLELSDGTVVAYVTDTEKDVTITIDLSDDLQKAAKDGKKIAVIRCHDGKTEFLNSTLNAAKTAVTFSSADFSTYAVVALDKVKSADTFDAGIGLYVGMSVLAATGSAVVIGKKRK